MPVFNVSYTVSSIASGVIIQGKYLPIVHMVTGRSHHYAEPYESRTC